MKSNRKPFLREARAFILIALFIFVLAMFTLFAQTLNFVLSMQTMESMAYVDACDDEYSKDADKDIREAITLLENDKDSPFTKRIYVLDKETSNIISTSSDVDSAIADELNTQSNKEYAFIGAQWCRVSDFTYYKVLVQVDLFPVVQEFLGETALFFLESMLLLVLVLIVLAVLRIKFLHKERKINLIPSSAMMLCFVAMFALVGLHTELEILDDYVNQEKTTVTKNLEYVCNGNYGGKNLTTDNINDVISHLETNSLSIKEIKHDNLNSLIEKASGAGTFDVANNIEIVFDDNFIKDKQTNFYIQAGLMCLLAFVLIHELYGKKGATFKQEHKEESSETSFTPDDLRIKTILATVGIATASFSIVNVLRIREVVMFNWTENTDVIIGAIFTITLLATLVGSFFSSTILKKCGNVKAYIIVAASLGLIGASLCGVSNNPVVFVIGLIVINIATVTVKMTGDFYTTLIENQERKDKCYIELDSGRSIGEVAGTIAGGIISAIVGYALLQMVVSVIFLLVIVSTFSLNGSLYKTSGSGKAGPKETLNSIKSVLKSKETMLYLLCMVIPGSIPYMLLEYKLPLDIAALGLTAIVLSFVKVIASVVNVYSMPLFHVVSRYLKPLNHAVCYRLACGGVLLFYLISGSLAGIFISVILLGFLNGLGTYSVTKTFRELPDNEKIPESDRFVALKVITKTGDTISPTILSSIQNPFVISGIVFVLPLIYFIHDKRRKMALKRSS